MKSKIIWPAQVFLIGTILIASGASGLLKSPWSYAFFLFGVGTGIIFTKMVVDAGLSEREEPPAVNKSL